MSSGSPNAPKVLSVFPPPVFDVVVNAVSESNFYAGLSGDATEGGVFYATYARLTVGMDVALALDLPGFGSSSVVGRVAWIREHSDDESRGVGIALFDLSDEARARIRAFTRLRPPFYCDDADS